MSTRYHITLGASTSAGGKVITASSFRSIHGAKVACEGDTIFCPACKSPGIIELAGARLSERVHGKQVALSDDLCRCKCSPPPILIASQNVSSQIIDAVQAAARDQQAAATATELNANAQQLPLDDAGLPFVLLDPKTEEPYRHRPYRLELKDRVIEGVTDQHGLTSKLNAAERAAVISWHIEGDTSPA